jgi:hypothetical protein
VRADFFMRKAMASPAAWLRAWTPMRTQALFLSNSSPTRNRAPSVEAEVVEVEVVPEAEAKS